MFRKKMRKILLVKTIVLFGILFLSTNGAKAEEITVYMKNYKYIPRSIVVKVGDKVTWINLDDNMHDTINGKDNRDPMAKKIWRSRGRLLHEKYSKVFKKTGIFPYYCSTHLEPDPTQGLLMGMKGTVVVKEELTAKEKIFMKANLKTTSDLSAEITGTTKTDIFIQAMVLINDKKEGIIKVLNIDGRTFTLYVPDVQRKNLQRRIKIGQELEIRANMIEGKLFTRYVIKNTSRLRLIYDDILAASGG
ncbi:MAG TPA: plastocyanin/azurin family copper-binding protein [Nitrospinota bacterium]|nr:plastocyanin/azurin family copper-binding protein [Nitrospinota bacterium]